MGNIKLILPHPVMSHTAHYSWRRVIPVYGKKVDFLRKCSMDLGKTTNMQIPPITDILLKQGSPLLL